MHNFIISHTHSADNHKNVYKYHMRLNLAVCPTCLTNNRFLSNLEVITFYFFIAVMHCEHGTAGASGTVPLFQDGGSVGTSLDSP